MPKVQEKDGEITFVEKIPNGLRIFLVIAGLFIMFFVSYEMLIRPNWDGFSIFLMISICMSVGAVLLGGLLITAGLSSLSKTLGFTKESETIHSSYESSLMSFRKKTYKFSDVANISMNTDWSELPPSYSLKLIFKDGQEVEIGFFDKRDEAEQSLSRIEEIIGLKTERQPNKAYA